MKLKLGEGKFFSSVSMSMSIYSGKTVFPNTKKNNTIGVKFVWLFVIKGGRSYFLYGSWGTKNNWIVVVVVVVDVGYNLFIIVNHPLDRRYHGLYILIICRTLSPFIIYDLFMKNDQTEPHFLQSKKSDYGIHDNYDYRIQNNQLSTPDSFYFFCFYELPVNAPFGISWVEIIKKKKRKHIMKSDISEISNINKILLNFDTKSCKWDKCVFFVFVYCWWWWWWWEFRKSISDRKGKK